MVVFLSGLAKEILQGIEASSLHFSHLLKARTLPILTTILLKSTKLFMLKQIPGHKEYHMCPAIFVSASIQEDPSVIDNNMRTI